MRINVETVVAGIVLASAFLIVFGVLALDASCASGRVEGPPCDAARALLKVLAPPAAR